LQGGDLRLEMNGVMLVWGAEVAERNEDEKQCKL